MSDSGRPSKAASGRMLDDGPMSKRKEMDDGTGSVMSNSRNILRRYLRADLDSDRMLSPVSGGKIDPQMGSVFTDLFFQSKISVFIIQRSMGLVLLPRRLLIAQPLLLLLVLGSVRFPWGEKERIRSGHG